MLASTVSPEELAWTALSLFAAAWSLRCYRRARGDLEIAEGLERGQRRYVIRAFREHVQLTRSRLLASLSFAVAGGLAMTTPQPAETWSRPPVEWAILFLLFAGPVYFLWRNVAEETSRRATLKDLEREARNGHGDEPTIVAKGAPT